MMGWKYAGSAGCGVVVGALLVLVVGFTDGNTPVAREGTRSKLFGDVVTLIEPIDDRHSVRGMLLSKANGSLPFIALYENADGKVDRLALVNGQHGALALCELSDTRITSVIVYGNPTEKVTTSPIFMFDAAEKPGFWTKVRYGPSAMVTEKGKAIVYRPRGEIQEDLDFDGQFDGKKLYDANFRILSESILVDGSWLEIFKMDKDGHTLKEGAYGVDAWKAYVIQGDRTTHYRFESGIGWKVDTSISDGTNPGNSK